MKESFGFLPSGEETFLYTISCGGMTAAVSDYGATLVRLLVPDSRGKAEDVVLGYDDCNGYRLGTCFLGAIVGRSANRIAGAGFELNGKKYFLTPAQIAETNGLETEEIRKGDCLILMKQVIPFRHFS